MNAFLGLTVVRHADFDALAQPAVLTLVPRDAHDDTSGRILTRLVLNVLLHRPPKESLWVRKKCLG